MTSVIWALVNSRPMLNFTFPFSKPLSILVLQPSSCFWILFVIVHDSAPYTKCRRTLSMVAWKRCSLMFLERLDFHFTESITCFPSKLVPFKPGYHVHCCQSMIQGIWSQWLLQCYCHLVSYISTLDLVEGHTFGHTCVNGL